MSNWSDYQREETKRLEAGDYRVVITNAEEAISKSSGNPMIVVTVKPSGSNIEIKNYIVKNEYFNRNMTSFFDSFDIEEGNFNFIEWVGAMGAAKLAEDEDGYLKVRWFLNKRQAEKLPEWKGDKPEKQEVSELPSEFGEDAEDDGLPF